MMLVVAALATGGAAPLAGGKSDAAGELRVVPKVDLPRYMGRWHEYARYPNPYQDGLVGVIAEYTMRADGRIRVINSARRGSLDAAETRSEAVAWSACHATHAKLYVQFFWPFKADYWIIDLGPDYEYAVVGQPGRERLWVLARQPALSPETYAGICERLKTQGYDPARLVKTPQKSE
jgi:apolipoprotein D and lipocalin family protein